MEKFNITIFNTEIGIKMDHLRIISSSFLTCGAGLGLVAAIKGLNKDEFNLDYNLRKQQQSKKN